MFFIKIKINSNYEAVALVHHVSNVYIPLRKICHIISK